MSAVVPFGVIVAVAIVFIVIAVLSSAQRANDVALDTEQQLFMRALADRGERVPEISDAVLKEIAWRLGLNNLRRMDAARSATSDHVLQLADEKGEALARFVWTPSTPGQEIIYRVIPFVLVALSAFALLAGLVLRHMRRTAETIEATETRLRHLAMHDPLCGLPNRIFFGEQLETTIENVRQTRAALRFSTSISIISRM